MFAYKQLDADFWSVRALNRIINLRKNKYFGRRRNETQWQTYKNIQQQNDAHENKF